MHPIQIAEVDSETDRKQMYSWLREFNESTNGDYMRSLSAGAEQTLYLSARVNDVCVAGLDGVTIHKWLKIQLMAVSPQHRRRGIGRKLITEAFAVGRQRGCELAYVDTMSYQAPEFYRCLGFAEVGRLVDWDSHGHDKIFFAMKLNAP